MASPRVANLISTLSPHLPGEGTPTQYAARTLVRSREVQEEHDALSFFDCTCRGSDRCRSKRQCAAALSEPSDHSGRALRRGRTDRWAYAHSRPTYDPDPRPPNRRLEPPGVVGCIV